MLKENIRRTAVTGVHKADLVLYMALILQKLNYKVLVCDRTAACEIKSAIRRPAKSMDLVRYQNIDFAFSELVLLDEEYDQIIYAEDFPGIFNGPAHQQLFVCDGLRQNMELLIRTLSHQKQTDKPATQNFMLLYRNLYSSHGMEYVQQHCPVQEDSVKVLPHECMDEAAYQRMQFQPCIFLPELSSALEAFLTEVLCWSTKLEERLVRRGIRQAKRGKAY